MEGDKEDYGLVKDVHANKLVVAKRIDKEGKDGINKVAIEVLERLLSETCEDYLYEVIVCEKQNHTLREAQYYIVELGNELETERNYDNEQDNSDEDSSYAPCDEEHDNRF